MVSFRVSIITAALAGLFVLQGCGGGGGDAAGGAPSPAPNTTPAPTEVLPPASPPAVTGTVINTVPTSGRHAAPQLVFNDGGLGLAVWESADAPIESTDHAGRAIWYAFYKDGQWSQESLLHVLPHFDSAGAGSNGYFNLQVAASANGFAVIWTQQDRTNDNSYYSKRLYVRVFNGTDWGAVTRLSPDEIGDAAISSNGTGYLVTWVNYASLKYFIYGSFFSGGSWQSGLDLASSSNPLTNPRVASNGAGYAVTWQETSLQDGNPWINARLFTGSSWGAVKSFAGLAGASDAPHLASSGGSYLLLWGQFSGAASGYESVGSDAGWSTAAPLSFGSIKAAVAGSSHYGVVYECGTRFSLCARVRVDGAWGTELPVENFTSDARNPVLASDGSGYGVLWRQQTTSSGDYDVHYTTFTATAVEPAVQVSLAKESGTSVASIPREAIAYDGSGYMLGWIQHDLTVNSNREEVYAQHYTGATSGARTTLLQLVHDGGTSTPTLTVNNAGVKLATWKQYYFENNTSSGAPEYRQGLFAAAYEAGAWGAPTLLDRYGTDAQVVTNGSSFAIVYLSNPNGSLRALIYSNGTFGPQQTLSSSTNYDPKVATDGTGYLVAWWQTGTVGLYVNRYDGSTWSGAVSIGGTNGYGIPQVASNGSGYAVAWKYAGAVYANVFDGAMWGGVQALDAYDTSASLPRIASNGSGYAVAWRQSDTTYESVFASLHDGTTWSAPVDIDGQNVAALYPEVVSNGTGYAVAWQQGGRCYARLWSSGWGSVSDVGACVSPTTANEVNLKMASDGSGYAFAFRPINFSPSGLYAAVYTGGTWQTVSGMTADGCGAPSDNAWHLRGGSGGYGLLTICDDGLYSNFDLVGRFFHNGAWGPPVSIESGSYAVGYFADLAADGATFTATWTQAHESQVNDPTAHHLYMRSGL